MNGFFTDGLGINTCQGIGGTVVGVEGGALAYLCIVLAFRFGVKRY